MGVEIAALRVHPLSVPLNRTFWMSREAYRTASEILIEIEATDGTVGVGQIHGSPQAEICAILEQFVGPMLVGNDAFSISDTWDELFRLSSDRRTSVFAASIETPHFADAGKAQWMAAIAGVDIALWDLKARVLRLPLFRLLGASSGTVTAYASGGYYGEDGGPDTEGLVDEVQSYIALGFSAVKIKVGGLSLEEDVRRVDAVRESAPDIDLMLDANCGYTLPEAIRAAHAFTPYSITWFEEPLAWYDPVAGLARLAHATELPLASGERELHRWGCRDLIDRAELRYLQYDCTRAGGITEWLRVAAYASAHGVLMAPHHDPQVHAHLISAVPNGHIVEVFPNEDRDPLWPQLYEARAQVVDGRLVLSEEPGLGVEVNWEFVSRHRSQVLGA